MHAPLKFFFFLVGCLLLASCGGKEPLPKPSGFLALSYEKSDYKNVTHSTCDYSFKVNKKTRVIAASDCSMKIEYPQMGATIFMSYKPVAKNNLRQLLIDGQKLSYGHNRMADVITDFPFQNPESNTYGMMYEIEGDAASNAQFYVTDSLNHFLTAALYFDTEPNYDSIYPAVYHVRQDMVKMLESLKWK